MHYPLISVVSSQDWRLRLDRWNPTMGPGTSFFVSYKREDWPRIALTLAQSGGHGARRLVGRGHCRWRQVGQPT